MTYDLGPKLHCKEDSYQFNVDLYLSVKTDAQTNIQIEKLILLSFKDNLIHIFLFRKSRDLRSLLTAALITLAVLDVLDILRVASSIIVNVHTFQEVNNNI